MTINSILTIEDDKGNQFFLKLMVEKYNKNVSLIQTCSTEEALEKLRELDEQPDLILLDLIMPGLDGFEFLKRYSQEFSHDLSSVVVMTSSDRETDRQKTQAYPCVIDYIVKPVSLDSLEKIEKFVIDRHVINKK